MRKICVVLCVLLVALSLAAAPTKSTVAVAANITMTAGAIDVTSSDLDLSGSYRHYCIVRFTNGATGPTVAPKVVIQVSPDTTSANYSNFAILSGDTVNSSITPYIVPLPDAAQHARFVSGSNTGQNVTLYISCDKITAI